MKKSVLAFAVPLLLAASFVRAAEMFETYPKKFALGYVSDEVNLRFWFNPAWGLDTSVGFENSKTDDKFDDGVVSSHDQAKSNGYSLSAAVVRTIRNYEYLDLNLKAGAGYSYGKTHDEPEGPSNDSRQKSRVYSLRAGPEVEIKLPYFSRLVIISSVQAVYSVEKNNTDAESIGGPTTEKHEAKTLTLSGDGNSLHELFHIGVRYYF